MRINLQKFLAAVPLAYAVRQSFKEGYRFSTFKSDVSAALVVSLVALPLAMALAIAVGLPPQHGLYTAIVAGITVPQLGGSATQVSGPTAAFVVIVAPIVTQYGLRGLIVTEMIAGLILIAAGIAKLGRYINYVPYPVTTGFTSGIAVVIGTLALNDFLGLGIADLGGDYLHKLGMILERIPAMNWPEALVGAVTLALMLTSGRIVPRVPPPLIGIAAGTLLAYFLQQDGHAVATIGSRFTFSLPDGTTGHGIPPFPPSLHLPTLDKESLFAWPSMAEVEMLFVPALVIAALGALESLLSATVADRIAGTRHHSNAELIGVGVGNVLSGMAAGIPATGAIARTATNIHCGGKTPLSSTLHAILILLYVVLFAPYLSYIPMASLAALLITVALRMSHYQQFVRILQIAPRSDVIVLLVCFSLTVFVDMVAGVTAGVVLACFLLVKQVASLTQAQVSHAGGRARRVEHLNLPDDVMVYHITGSLFFGTVEKTLDKTIVPAGVNTLILDMENVPLIDMSGLVAMKAMLLELLTRNRWVILCGKDEITHRILQKLPEDVRDHVSITDTVENAVELLR